MCVMDPALPLTARHIVRVEVTIGRLPHCELTHLSVFHCRSWEVVEEDGEEGEYGEEVDERRDLEEEGPNAEPRPLDGAVSTLKQENAFLRLELGRLQQLVKERATHNGREDMYMYVPSSRAGW